MRILLLNDYASPLGGAEVAQEVLREALRRRGHEVRLFAARPRMRDGGRSTADYECFGTVSRFRTLLQAFNPWAAVALGRTLKEFRPDVVHVRVFLTQLSPLILPLLRNVPSLHHVTWYRSMCPVGTKVLPDGNRCRERAGLACCRHRCIPRRDWLPLLIQIKLWRRWMGVFRLMIANSEEGRCLMANEGVERVDVLWNGVPVVPVRPTLSPTPTIFFAGRLVHQKGVDVLLRAFARVATQIPHARLWIAGDGPERASLTRLAEDLGVLPSCVSMLGHLDGPTLERATATAWAQVVPSRWAESFGNVAAEAMMRGTAVIASATGAMAEYIRDGETGILVPPGDEGALATALMELLQNRELADEMGRRGREVALRDLTADVWAERFESVYRGLAEQHLAGPGESGQH
jgi:glycosyltransferase involved in cell wall biosynthesis